MHNKRRFTLSEKRSQVHFVNEEQQEIEEIVVDGCAINDGIRCDLLINVRNVDLSVFVEFKGSDVNHAIKQLTRSHDLLADSRHSQVYWIVSSQRCPLTSDEINKQVRKLRAEKGITLRVRNSPVPFSIPPIA